MILKTITSTFSISGELSEQALIQLGENGVSTLINVRPDNEAPEQKSDVYWRDVCNKHGLSYFHIPVTPGQYPERDVQRFKAALEGADKKVHSFCRTGTRAAHLFSLANRNKYTFEQLQQLFKGKGYDLGTISAQFHASVSQ